VSLFPFFSFTEILSIGGVISGGIMGVLAVFIVKSAKKKGKRQPEYSIPINWWIITIITIIFTIGVLSILVKGI
jgi:heme/copper-type cytochrome/quinol oxidase subunit 2